MRWEWSVWGKHPTFKDYFHLGSQDPLSRRMAEWIRSGYAQIKIDRAPRNFFSWRFWMKSLRKEGLALGLLKDSGDYLGRPYPVLFMGMGSLPGWEKNWDLLPLALEDVWNRMESLLARSYKTLQNLEEEIYHLPAPCGEWEEMNQRRGAQDNPNIEEGVKKNLKKDTFFINLDQSFHLPPMVLVSLYHYFWKKHGEPIPNCIFMGGSLAKTFLAFFCRPLLPKDFQDLWSDSLID
ncbi:MAG: TagF domain-containing protein [Thermodesulfobacteriota bacterium]